MSQPARQPTLQTKRQSDTTSGHEPSKPTRTHGAAAGMPRYLRRRSVDSVRAAPLIRRQQQDEAEETLQNDPQNTLMRQQGEEEEAPLQPKMAGPLQRQLDDADEPLQAHFDETLNRQPDEPEEEELVQAKMAGLQRQQSDEKEEEWQAKLEVGTAGDEYEQEADQVADQVMRMPRADSAAIRRTEIKLRRASRSPETPQLSAGSENRIQQMRGSGAPLPAQVSQQMGDRMGADFSSVGVHTGSEASQLNQQINARAFTIGNDIFFKQGEYAPQSESGQHLLAHELTHVVQQGEAGAGNIQRDNDGGMRLPPGVTDLNLDNGDYGFRKNGRTYKYIASNRPKELQLPVLRIPNFKRRHRDAYSPPLTRPPKPQGRGATRQRQNWRSHFSPIVATSLQNKINDAQDKGGFRGDGSERMYFFKATRNHRLMLFGTQESLLEPAIFPFWNRRQRTKTFQVDHVLEDQLGGADDQNCSNYELLEAGANGRSGGMIARELNSKIGSAVSVFGSPYFRSKTGGGQDRISGRMSYIKQNYQVVFEQVFFNLGAVPGSDSYWSVSDITQGRHLNQFRALNSRQVQQIGQAGQQILYASPTGGMPIRAPESSGQRVKIWDRVFASSPLQIKDDNTATIAVDAYRAGDKDKTGPSASYPGMQFYFNRITGLDAWAIDKGETLKNAKNQGNGGVFTSLRLPGLSPLRIDELDLTPGQGFVGRGKLLPSVPLLSAADIDIVVQGADIRLQKTFDLGEMNIPRPFSINYSTVTAFMGTRGLGVEGLLGFGIERIGEGELQARVSSAQGLNLSGRFNFDERIFGRGSQAQIRMAYRKEGEEYQWSMGGTLTIPRGKVPGVRSATINVDYSEAQGFSAEGDAELDVPGVESGRLAITHSEQDGFVIGGSFNLSADTPGIRGGSISARVRERPDGGGYAVSASGEAQPDIPGIDSNLAVRYDDGAFTAEVTAQYTRGMLSGRIHAGVTNRSVGEDGQLSEAAQPDNPLIVYGGGSLTVQIAPWLQGTAGVEFAPNGEITVTGEIALPDELEIFARREINKSIFNIAVQAPLFPGIVAEVGGGLSATAGIGPGVIDQLQLGITYNPEHEEDTTITGDAHLRVPANAGLRLSVRAGIGLGITGASATGGLEVGGTLGIEGAAEAGVHVDWTPTRGLDLTAMLSIHAQPAFTFDISGYVSVRALGFSVYDETWRLASFRFGSDYRFGIRLPVHYQEGQPFNISADDIEFEVPDIDTDRLLKRLISRIA